MMLKTWIILELISAFIFGYEVKNAPAVDW